MAKVFARVGSAAALAVALTMTTLAHADVESARRALASDDYNTAIQQLNDVLDNQPKNAEALFLKGLAMARSGNTDAALGVFQKLTKAQPDMAEAWNNLGVLQARKGHLKAARDALMQAVQRNAQHGPAQENLGDIYVALARNAYSRAGRLESDNAIARSKSQQLASFINNAGGLGAASQAPDKQASNAQSRPPRDSGNRRSAQSSPPPAQPDRVVIDTSTPAAAVKSWARAWSAQDVDAYLSMYSNDFEPEDQSSRAAWAADRRDHVRSPERIDISLSDSDVERGAGQALVTFDQRYESDSYQDEERKALLLTKTSQGWKILREGKAGEVEMTAQSRPASGNRPTRRTTGQRQDNNASSNASASIQRGSGRQDTGRATNRGDTAGSIARQPDNSGDSDVGQQVRTALQDWADAWSDQDVQTYLDAYSNNFDPADGQALSTWVRERRDHVSRPAYIDIGLSDIEIESRSDDRVEVSFDQRYESNTYQDEERKHMTLVREDGEWRIASES